MYKKILFMFFYVALALPCFAQETKDFMSAGSKEKAPRVLLSTNMGEILLELDPKKSPITVENFLTYVNKKYYDGLIFHRVIRGFMIQAGGFNEDISRMNPSEESIKNESFNGLKNKKYTVAMARTVDPDSAKAQFFINVVDNVSLDSSPEKPGYAVFGKVVRGMSVADKISRLPTQRAAGMRDVPTATVKIIKARVVIDK